MECLVALRDEDEMVTFEVKSPGYRALNSRAKAYQWTVCYCRHLVVAEGGGRPVGYRCGVDTGRSVGQVTRYCSSLVDWLFSNNTDSELSLE